jgi:hypothetical protein
MSIGRTIAVLLNRAVAPGSLRLAHAIADDFAASELHLLAIGREVLLHLYDEIGIGEAHLVADRWAKHLRIGGTAHYMGHFRLPQSIQRKRHADTCGNAPMTAWLGAGRFPSLVAGFEFGTGRIWKEGYKWISGRTPTESVKEGLTTR